MLETEHQDTDVFVHKKSQRIDAIFRQPITGVISYNIMQYQLKNL
jgi:hypothetical protein